MVDVTPPPIHVRRATDADAEDMFRVHVESILRLCAKDYTPEQIRAWIDPKHPDNYRKAMREGETHFVATAGREVIGFACHIGGEVNAVYVHPDHVRRGAGRALLAAIEQNAAAHGVHHLELNSTITSVSFYERNGFRQLREKLHTLKPSGVQLECIRMAKDLVPRINPE